MPVKISVKHLNESRFVPQDKPAMSFMDAFEIVKKQYKDAFDYLRDK